MKKYILKMLQNDIEQMEKYRDFVIEYLKRKPNDEYHIRRKKAYDKKIAEVEKYIKRIEIIL